MGREYGNRDDKVVSVVTNSVSLPAVMSRYIIKYHDRHKSREI